MKKAGVKSAQASTRRCPRMLWVVVPQDQPASSCGIGEVLRREVERTKNFVHPVRPESHGQIPWRAQVPIQL